MAARIGKGDDSKHGCVIAAFLILSACYIGVRVSEWIARVM